MCVRLCVCVFRLLSQSWSILRVALGDKVRRGEFSEVLIAWS